MNRTLLRLAQTVGLLTVGAVVGYTTGEPAETITRPHNVASCEGGTQNNLQIAINPVAVQSGKYGERLALAIDVQSRFEKKAQALVALQLVDDRGRAVMAPIQSKTMALLPGIEGMQTLEFTTPEKLEDGFYKLIATGAALQVDGSPAENIVQMYLQRERGEFRSLTYEEYVTSSNALVEVAVR